MNTVCFGAAYTWPTINSLVEMRQPQPKKVVLEKLLVNKDVIKHAAQDENIWCIEIY